MRGNRTTRIGIGLIGAVAVFGIGIGIGGCGGGGSNSAYPANVQTNFLNSCESNGGSSDTCQCTLSYLEKHTSYTQFLADEDQVNTGTSVANVPDLSKAVNNC